MPSKFDLIRIPEITVSARRLVEVHMKRVIFPLLCLLLWSYNSHAQAPFYQGKTIRVIVGTPPGNLYDLWARLIVAHMGKHIPGNPEFIVQNMPGAGHVVAANHLYSMVKPDGLTLTGSIIPSLYLNQLIGRSEIQFDWAKFTWIRLAGPRRIADVHARGLSLQDY